MNQVEASNYEEEAVVFKGGDRDFIQDLVEEVV